MKRTIQKIQAIIIYHIPQFQFNTLPSGIVLRGMQLPVLQELNAM